MGGEHHSTTSKIQYSTCLYGHKIGHSEPYDGKEGLPIAARSIFERTGQDAWSILTVSKMLKSVKVGQYVQKTYRDIELNIVKRRLKNLLINYLK